ncbi:MAG: hypothetical protein MUF49_01175 [Oculatellaceae cyanobacterium Prado106]|nr:hypothetical protein [Oculatellaceae cyanobacterium Prado106]
MSLCRSFQGVILEDSSNLKAPRVEARIGRVGGATYLSEANRDLFVQSHSARKKGERSPPNFKNRSSELERFRFNQGNSQAPVRTIAP